MDSSRLKGHLALAAAYTIFGINIVTTKDVSNSHLVTPIALFSLRAISSAVIFWLISLFIKKEAVPLKDLGKIVVASFFGLFVPQFTFLEASTMSTPMDTSIVSTLSPIFTMFFAFFFVKEPVTWKKAIGVMLSFAGIIFLIFNSVHSSNGIESTSPRGFALLFLNCISFALYLGAFRPLIARYSVITFMKWMFLFAALMALPFSSHDLLTTEYSKITPVIAAEIGFLVIFATMVAYFLIPFGQKSVRPTIVAMYTYLQPIIASVISIWNGMDVITWQKTIAVAMVFAGVFIVNRSRSAAQTAK